ncbi:bacteriohemerythrin [bacterium BMS3Abin04]|nr:bacteriohemerythrin [bacterium BMS3Abin04]
MEYVTWCGVFSVKNPHIDQQHKNLFSIVNEFHSAVKQKSNKSEIFSILNKLIQYTEAHFKDEEKIAKASRCPANTLQEHIAEHEKLIEDIFNLNSELQSGKERTLSQLEEFLDKWLILHVLVHDKAYAYYLKK